MHLPEAPWELFTVPKSYYCVFNGSLDSVAPLPSPHLLLYWNRFVQCGNFVTFLMEGNFLSQHYLGRFVFFFQEGGLTTKLFSFSFVFLCY